MVDCAIIGCGLIAGGYDTVESELIRTHAKAFYRHPDCRLVAVIDSDPVIARSFAKKWGADNYGTDAESILKESHPRLVSICTPISFHEESFNIALDSGAKIIWLEKPAAKDENALCRMVEKAQEHMLTIWINYFRRYDPGFWQVVRDLPNLGYIQHVRGIYTKGLRHNGSHMLDLLLWFFGAVKEIEDVSVLADPDYPTVSARLIMEKAVVELIGLDYHSYELFELDIIGKNGRIRIIDGGQHIVFEGTTEGKYYEGYRNLAETKIHEGTYGLFMLNGLERGLAGEPMPGFENEMMIQDLIDRVSLQAGVHL